MQVVSKLDLYFFCVLEYNQEIIFKVLYYTRPCASIRPLFYIPVIQDSVIGPTQRPDCQT